MNGISSALNHKKLNHKKTQMAYIHSQHDHDVTSYFYSAREKICPGSKLKLVGFNFGATPNVNVHFDYTKKK